MDMNSVIEFINTLGFPIAVCGALFWYLIKQNEAHREETEKLRQALENNTLIITKLYERLGGAKNE